MTSLTDETRQLSLGRFLQPVFSQYALALFNHAVSMLPFCCGCEPKLTIGFFPVPLLVRATLQGSKLLLRQDLCNIQQ